MLTTVSCPCGQKVFFAVANEFIDSEAKLEIAYYKSQGCIVNDQYEGAINFGSCECELKENVQHDFHKLIEDIVDENCDCE